MLLEKVQWLNKCINKDYEDFNYAACKSIILHSGSCKSNFLENQSSILFSCF